MVIRRRSTGHLDVGSDPSAGTYSVVRDGTDLAGAPVASGDYLVHIEAAREDGPYELESQRITIGGQGFEVPMGDAGELTGASVRLLV